MPISKWYFLRPSLCAVKAIMMALGMGINHPGTCSRCCVFSSMLRYASLKLMPRFGTPFRNAFAARLRRKPEGFFQKSEGFFRESESFFRRIGSFFRRALGSYTHKFPKRGAVSLTYLPRSRLDLPRSRLGLPCLHLSRNSGPATEGFSNHGIKFKDAYRSLGPCWLHTSLQVYQFCTFTPKPAFK